MCQGCGCPSAGSELFSFRIDGIKGLECVQRIEKVLLALPGVCHVHIHAHDGLAKLEHNPSRTSVDDVVIALNAAGYSVIC
ncbi:hypothetical protein SCACP_37220 [Sporomusa carbonis]|uniref:heavy-metal-associated domain-containing protein n=1 Tax=Sporomusa carbonis TaxID=3076075 RepID=UPI003A67070A